VLVPGEDQRRIPALPVRAVDTTGAGDAFCGCVAASVAQQRPLAETVQRAIAAGAFAVTAEGAFASLPNADDVDDLLDQVRTDAQN
jgi:ribokinase